MTEAMIRPAPMLSLIPTLLVAAALGAQTPTFEVTSIKPNDSGSGRSSESTNPGRLTAENITISSLIQQAFGVKEFQISGAGGWVTGDDFDIAGKTGTSKDLNDKEMQPYLRTLLADRFSFRFHRETKELQIYSLVVAKTGARLAAHTGEGDSSTNINN